MTLVHMKRELLHVASGTRTKRINTCEKLLFKSMNTSGTYTPKPHILPASELHRYLDRLIIVSQSTSFCVVIFVSACASRQN